MKFSTSNRTRFLEIGVVAATMVSLLGSAPPPSPPLKPAAARFFLFRSPRTVSYFSFLSLQEWYIHTNIWANLTRLDRMSQIQGELATEWEVRDGGKEYRFKLARDRKWSDGTSITPQQIHRSLVAATMKRNGKILAHLVRGGPDAAAVRKAITLEDGDTTLVIRLNHAQPKLLHHLTRAEFGIVDLDSLGDDGILTETTKTSGDYKIGHLSDTQLVLERVEGSGPTQVVFDKIENHPDALKRVESGELDFFEIQSDDVITAAHNAPSGTYQIIDGALDNLATLQARKLTPDVLSRLAELSRGLDRTRFASVAGGTPTTGSGVFSTNRRVPARTLLALSEAEPEAVPTSVPPKSPPAPLIPLVLELGTEATSDQLADASVLKREASKFGIALTIKTDVPDFRQRWESEAYELTLTRMGVTHYDEADLWNGYLCAGYKPYASLAGIACPDIKGALEHPTGAPERKSSLKSAYKKILESGYIIPLYHYPRRYLLNKRWNLVDYNVDRPYPRFMAFREVVAP